MISVEVLKLTRPKADQPTNRTIHMIIQNENTATEQARRLKIKTQDQRLVKLVVDGTGLSPWEAEELVEVVKEVYFNEPENGTLRSGQMLFECIDANEGAGKPLKECTLQRIVLTIHDPEDQAIRARDGSERMREHIILRLTEEAREQGGLLSQEDLSRFLFCHVRTIRRCVQNLRKRGIVVATRGQQNDIGPGVSHRGVAVKHWIEGMEPVEVARRIKHSLKAVERYLQNFARVVFLQQRGFDPLATALAMGVSVAQVTTYREIHDLYKDRPEFARRAQEIQITGGKFHEAIDFEKGGPTQNAKSKKG